MLNHVSVYLIRNAICLASLIYSVTVAWNFIRCYMAVPLYPSECSENVNLELRFNKINKGILRYFYVKLAFFVPTSMRFLGQLCPALVCAQELTVLATILSAPSVLMTHRRKGKSSLTVSVKNSFDLVDL